LFGLPDGVSFEAANAVPSEQLWQIPDDTAEEVRAVMPDESNVEEIFETYFLAEDRPKLWSMNHARGLVNFGRQNIYRRYYEGFYKEHPEYLHRTNTALE
jgi:hypothetical protein